MKSAIIFVGLVALLAPSLPAARGAPFPGVFDDIKTLIDSDSGITKSVLAAIQTAVQAYYKSLETAIQSLLTQTQEALAPQVEKILSALKTFLSSLLASVKGLVDGASLTQEDKDAINAQVKELEALIAGLVPGVGTGVVDTLTTIKSKVDDLFTSLGKGITGAGDTVETIKTYFANIFDLLIKIVKLATTTPATGTTTPVAGTTTPVAGTTTPVAGTTTPVAGTTTPVAGTTTPVAGTTAAVVSA